MKSIPLLVLLMSVSGLKGGGTRPHHSQEVANTAQVFSQENKAVIQPLDQNAIERMAQENLKLKKLFGDPGGDDEIEREQVGSQALELVRGIWAVLDEALAPYLAKNVHSSVQEINKALEALLHITPTVDEGGWTARIELYSVGTRDLCLAQYGNWFQLGTVVSTLRVLQRIGGRWQIVGRMEDTAFVKSIEPSHQEELRQLVEAREGLLDAPNTWVDRANSIARKSIQMSGMSISTRPIQQLRSGGLRFATIHTALGRGNISVETLIEWEWAPARGLEAVAWVWGDEWTYDENLKTDVARWNSLDMNKNGKLVKLSDFSSR
jgi:hypothetical protein